MLAESETGDGGNLPRKASQAGQSTCGARGWDPMAAGAACRAGCATWTAAKSLSLTADTHKDEIG